jgi:hypothetical protein
MSQIIYLTRLILLNNLLSIWLLPHIWALLVGLAVIMTRTLEMAIDWILMGVSCKSMGLQMLWGFAFMVWFVVVCGIVHLYGGCGLVLGLGAEL